MTTTSLSLVLDSLVKRYEGNSVLRALIQLIPLNVGSAAEVAVLTKIHSIRAERARIFFDELGRGEQQLLPELLESNDFLHCYFATAEAALKTNRREKICYLARLLAASAQEDCFSDIDEFEEYLSIIDELSNRELSILIALDSYECKHPNQAEENDFQRALKFWEQFVDELTNHFAIAPAEIDAVLIRLIRTGCYELFQGAYYDATGGKGRTTPTFQRLKSLVINRKI
jgi:hypothetical protein